jgi:hypothetical protein
VRSSINLGDLLDDREFEDFCELFGECVPRFRFATSDMEIREILMKVCGEVQRRSLRRMAGATRDQLNEYLRREGTAKNNAVLDRVFDSMMTALDDGGLLTDRRTLQ